MGLTDLDEVVIESALKVVDIYEDPMLGLCWPKGCNATVCGEAWIKNAKQKFNALGYHVVDLPGDEKSFRGLAGDSVTMGQCRFLFALSEHARAALAFTKSMGDGVFRRRCWT